MSAVQSVSRRSFLKSVAVSAGAVSIPAVLTGCLGDDDDDQDSAVFVFGHGVASGDPLSDAVIIWTRVTPDSNSANGATVAWAVATDEAMISVVASGAAKTTVEKDFTVKVDVSGLDADTIYYYQFAVSDSTASVVGQTRTLPTGTVDSVSMAVCSCANYPAGLFNVYREMANSDADVIVHLGDYIYEYGSDEYPTADADGRTPEPATEILTLDQYRARYSQYRIDEDLQLAHQHKPFICVWDDHEVANDTYVDGAENHDEDTEGSFIERRAAAIQAYHEWMPIRTQQDDNGNDDLLVIDRSFDFGDLVSLHMLDTRVVARSQQLSYSDYFNNNGTIDSTSLTAAMLDGTRTLFGTNQQTRVLSRIGDSPATWQVLGQQVLMGRMNVPQSLLLKLAQVEAALSAGADDDTLSALQADMTASLASLYSMKMGGTDDTDGLLDSVAPYNLDAWDGYMMARETLLASIKGLDKNLVVLAGDTHNAWANDLYLLNASYEIDRDAGSAGVEFATGSVTSPGFERYAGFGDDRAAQASFETVITTLIDDLKYLNAAQRGYMLVQYTAEKTSCSWNFVNTIGVKSYSVDALQSKTLEVYPGSTNRILVDPDAIV